MKKLTVLLLTAVVFLIGGSIVTSAYFTETIDGIEYMFDSTNKYATAVGFSTDAGEEVFVRSTVTDSDGTEYMVTNISFMNGGSETVKTIAALGSFKMVSIMSNLPNLETLIIGQASSTFSLGNRYPSLNTIVLQSVQPPETLSTTTILPDDNISVLVPEISIDAYKTALQKSSPFVTLGVKNNEEYLWEHPQFVSRLWLSEKIFPHLTEIAEQKNAIKKILSCMSEAGLSSDLLGSELSARLSELGLLDENGQLVASVFSENSDMTIFYVIGSAALGFAAAALIFGRKKKTEK